MLFLVPTPIGNLADITLRALATLREVDLILCEDTRHSLQLLRHYEIQKPLLSFHQFNESKRSSEVITLLQQGKQIALISDAGSPAIADPGMRLVRRCHQEHLPVTALPGACAAICALTLSGLDSSRFHFIGFVPKGESDRKEEFLQALMSAGTTICYESPHRIVSSLKLLAELDPTACIGVARELTKHFEEFVCDDPHTLANSLHPQGEIVLLIPGNPERNHEFLKLDPKTHVQQLMDTYGLSKQEALKFAAKQRRLPKRIIYKNYEEE